MNRELYLQNCDNVTMKFPYKKNDNRRDNIKKTETTQTADIIIKQKEPLYQNKDKETPRASYPPKGGTAKIKKQNNPKT